MITGVNHKSRIQKDGFTVVENIFSEEEIFRIWETIVTADHSKPNFRKTDGLFAIRQFLKEIPGVLPYIFSKQLNNVIMELIGNDYFVVKSIYFDKPPESNWFVAYHQDLTISVDRKSEIDGFGPWSTKENQFAVQPPLDILRSNFTVRIHLDETDEQNGALWVIPGSHLKGIYRPDSIDWASETETVCRVAKGGIMIMKPLLLHSSRRTTNMQARKVVHIEFSNQKLPGALKWSEFLPMSEIADNT